MRAAEVLVELLLGEYPITEARSYAFIYKNPQTLDALTKKQLKDEFDEIKLERSLTQSGGNALIVDVNSRKVRILGPDPKGFWANLRKQGDVHNFWKRAVAAERRARTTDARKEKEDRWSGELERQKWREQHKEKEQAQAQGDWEKETGQLTLGVAVKPHPEGLEIVRLKPGGPLARVGAKPGMVIRSFGEVELSDEAHLNKLVAGASEGTYRVRVIVPGVGPRDAEVTPERSAP
jgi:hypothetical protein